MRPYQYPLWDNAPMKLTWAEQQAEARKWIALCRAILAVRKSNTPV